MDDLRGIDDGHLDERPFAAVARASEMQAQAYDLMLRPMVKAMVTETTAEMGRAMHPLRLSRALMSSRNPITGQIKTAAEKVAAEREPAAPENPFIRAEALWVQMTEQAIDLVRDQRDMMFELAFHTMWGTPWMRMFGKSHDARRTLKNATELRNLPEVIAALHNIERGGFVEGVIRMLVLLADNRGTVRRDRLERSSMVLTRDEPFKSLTAERRAMTIHEQTLIATYETDRAVETLPLLLTTPEERELAVRTVQFIPGLIEEMTPATLEMLQRFHKVLGLAPVTEDVLADPLASGDHAATTTDPDVLIAPDALPAGNIVPEAAPTAPTGTGGARTRRTAAAKGAVK